jgi:branched-chain amino acid transport system ATP-binding protein
LGIGYVPEDRRIYPDFTVNENILLGTWRRKVNTDAIFEKVYALFPKLKDLSQSLGIHLSGGEQSMLAIARTLALEPRCLLLDEPLEGLAPAVRKRLAEGISELRAQGLTTLTTASDMSYVPDIADTIYTIDRGEIVERADKKS